MLDSYKHTKCDFEKLTLWSIKVLHKGIVDSQVRQSSCFGVTYSMTVSSEMENSTLEGISWRHRMVMGEVEQQDVLQVLKKNRILQGNSSFSRNKQHKSTRKSLKLIRFSRPFLLQADISSKPCSEILSVKLRCLEEAETSQAAWRGSGQLSYPERPFFFVELSSGCTAHSLLWAVIHAEVGLASVMQTLWSHFCICK